MVRSFLYVCWLVLVALSLAGSPQQAVAQSGSARVRIAHASLDLPAVDVFVDGKQLLTNVAPSMIGDYVEVPAGSH